MIAGFTSNHTYMQGYNKKISNQKTSEAIAFKSNFLRRRDKLEAEAISSGK